MLIPMIPDVSLGEMGDPKEVLLQMYDLAGSRSTFSSSISSWEISTVRCSECGTSKVMNTYGDQARPLIPLCFPDTNPPQKSFTLDQCLRAQFGDNGGSIVHDFECHVCTKRVSVKKFQIIGLNQDFHGESVLIFCMVQHQSSGLHIIENEGAPSTLILDCEQHDLTPYVSFFGSEEGNDKHSSVVSGNIIAVIEPVGLHYVSYVKDDCFNGFLKIDDLSPSEKVRVCISDIKTPLIFFMKVNITKDGAMVTNTIHSLSTETCVGFENGNVFTDNHSSCSGEMPIPSGTEKIQKSTPGREMTILSGTEKIKIEMKKLIGDNALSQLTKIGFSFPLPPEENESERDNQVTTSYQCIFFSEDDNEEEHDIVTQKAASKFRSSMICTWREMTNAARARGDSLYHCTHFGGGFLPHDDAQVFMNFVVEQSKIGARSFGNSCPVFTLNGCGEEKVEVFYLREILVLRLMENKGESKVDLYLTDSIINFVMKFLNYNWGCRTDHFTYHTNWVLESLKPDQKCGGLRNFATAWPHAKRFLKGDQISSSGIHFFPFNIGGFHWIVMVVDMNREQIYSLDSLYDPNDESYKNLSKDLKAFLSLALIKSPENPILPNIASWNYKALKIPKKYRQPDHHNCGVFVLMYVCAISEDKEILNNPSKFRNTRPFNSGTHKFQNSDIFRLLIFQMIVGSTIYYHDGSRGTIVDKVQEDEDNKGDEGGQREQWGAGDEGDQCSAWK